MQITSETNHNSNTKNTPETPRSHEENHEQRNSLDETCNNTNNHDQQNLDSIKEQIKHTQKLIRNLNRLNQNKWLKEQEELLELSITEGNKAETQRLCRAIAGQHRGILKRRHDQIPVRKPLNAELTDMAQTPADEGGLGGTIINIDDQRHEWTTNAPEHRQAVNRDLNIDHLVKKELNQTIRTLKKMKKRKAAPEWSCPTELLILATDPHYVATAHQAKTGLGNQAMKDNTTFQSCKECLHEVMKHMHYTGSAPINANRSKAFFTINASGGLRTLHVLCSYWKAYFAGNLHHYESKGHHPDWTSTSHAYLPGRRREGAIATAITIQHRIRTLGLNSFATLRDLRNAFCCTSDQHRTVAMKEFIPETDFTYYNQDYHPVGLDHRRLFHERIANTIIELECHDGKKSILSQRPATLLGHLKDRNSS